MKKLAFAVALALLIATPAAAARPYKGVPLRANFSIAGETISVSPDLIAFDSVGTISYTSGDDAPWVRIHCYNPSLVLDTYHDVFRGSVTFYIGVTPSWSGGPATCYATLLGFTDGDFTPLAETTFSVAP